MLRAVHSSWRALLKTQIKGVVGIKQAKFQAHVNSVRLYTTNTDVQAWTESLDEAQQKRIRHIQNEVSAVLLLDLFWQRNRRKIHYSHSTNHILDNVVAATKQTGTGAGRFNQT